MNWNIFWGCYLLAFDLPCILLVYFLCIKKVNKESRCSECVRGIVSGYSAINYGGIHIPKVQYMVDGRMYKVAGPKFQSGSTVTISTPFADPMTQMESNLTTRENLPKKLKVKIHKNSVASMTFSPLNALYPQGSDVEVYYNPRKPKDAYVQRFEGVSKWMMVLFAIIICSLTAMSLFAFFGPTLVMS